MERVPIFAAQQVRGGQAQGIEDRYNAILTVRTTCVIATVLWVISEGSAKALRINFLI